MSLARAGVFLVYASLKNRALRLVKHPKNLAFTLLGLASIFGGNAGNFVRAWKARGASQPDPALAFGESHPSMSALMTLVQVGVVIVMVAGIWLIGSSKVALQFTEAEVQFLFPAPVSRKSLINYKLARLLVGTALTAPLLALLAGRGRHPVFLSLGLFLTLATFSLHRVGASLTVVSSSEHGASGRSRRMITLGIVTALLAGFAIVFVQTAASLPPLTLRDLPRWFAALDAWARDHERSLSWTFLPIIAAGRVMLARSASDVAIALPVALLVFGLHYRWAVSSSAAFEESAAVAATERARRLEDAKSRKTKFSRGAPTFRLRAEGAPWVALLWKNFCAEGRTQPRRYAVIFALAFVLPAGTAVAFQNEPRASSLLLGAGALALTVALLAAFVGPFGTKSDLRADLPNMDLLRSFPLSGRELAKGAMLAPFLRISFIIVTSLVAGIVLIGSYFRHHEPRQVLLVLTAGAAALVFLPAFAACGLVLQNLVAAHFPTWAVPTDPAERGMEASGRRVLTFVLAMLTLLVGLLPTAVAAGIAALVTIPLTGLYGIPLVALVGAGVAFLEAYVGLVYVGRALDQLDVSAR